MQTYHSAGRLTPTLMGRFILLIILTRRPHGSIPVTNSPSRKRSPTALAMSSRSAGRRCTILRSAPTTSTTTRSRPSSRTRGWSGRASRRRCCASISAPHRTHWRQRRRSST
uniref:(northern house mosquito) hypothetical protein n=1 Tax=Culex pipiens TaxID=7175 RepID=A0A8D8IG93_CULPI